MYVVMNRIPVQPEFAQAFEERFRSRAGEVDKMPGFIRNLVLRPDRPEDPYVVLTMWESREAFEAWTRSDAFQKGHARSGTLPREAFRGPNKLETFTAFLDSADPEEPANR
ncbi:MAG: antibiotic biosynthesis monooxygenase [Firmicutes bacterium]|nr:antibiotic biosynthesis monooxygenase [Bacillota bacterium]